MSFIIASYRTAQRRLKPEWSSHSPAISLVARLFLNTRWEEEEKAWRSELIRYREGVFFKGWIFRPWATRIAKRRLEESLPLYACFIFHDGRVPVRNSLFLFHISLLSFFPLLPLLHAHSLREDDAVNLYQPFVLSLLTVCSMA